MIAGEQDRHTHIADKGFHHGDRIPGVNNLEGGETSFGLEIVEVWAFSRQAPRVRGRSAPIVDSGVLVSLVKAPSDLSSF